MSGSGTVVFHGVFESWVLVFRSCVYAMRRVSWIGTWVFCWACGSVLCCLDGCLALAVGGGDGRPGRVFGWSVGRMGRA